MLLERDQEQIPAKDSLFTQKTLFPLLSAIMQIPKPSCGPHFLKIQSILFEL